MKIHLLLSPLLLFILCSNIQAQEDLARPDSYLSSKGGVTYLHMKDSFFYNYSGEATRANRPFNSKKESIYDTDGKAVEESLYEWYGGWRKHLSVKNEYAENGRLIRSMRRRLDDITGKWKDFSKDTYKYDNTGKLIESIFYVWDEYTSVRSPVSRTSYFYDAMGKQTETFCQGWDGYQWVDGLKWLSTRDKNGKQTEVLLVYKDCMSDNWVNQSLETFTRNSNGAITEYIYSKWNPNTNDWVKSRKYMYTYDSLGNKVKSVTYERLENANEWRPIEKDSYTNDMYGNEAERNNARWNNALNKFAFATKEASYWSTQQKVTLPVNDAIQCFIYPNPVKNVLHVDGLKEKTQASIYSTQGDLFESIVLYGAAEQIDVRQLPAGVYFLRLNTIDKSMVQRFLKL